jgi:hypothetical protein
MLVHQGLLKVWVNMSSSANSREHVHLAPVQVLALIHKEFAKIGVNSRTHFRL